MPIPKIIHQTWKDPAIPDYLARYSDSWKRKHPEYKYVLWTDADNYEFLRTHHKWFLPFYESYQRPIQRADAIRYFILYTYGGIYADLDFECLRSFDDLLEDNALVLGEEPCMHPGGLRETGRLLCNALMLSVPRHEYWRHVIEQMVLEVLKAEWRAKDGLTKEGVTNEDVLAMTGPLLVTRAYESFKNKKSITIMDSEKFYPIPDFFNTNAFENKKEHMQALEKGEKNLNAYGQSYAVHHWAGTWYEKAPKFLFDRNNIESLREYINSQHKKRRSRKIYREIKNFGKFLIGFICGVLAVLYLQ